MFIDAGADVIARSTQMGDGPTPSVATDSGAAALKWVASISALAVLGLGGYLLLSPGAPVAPDTADATREALRETAAAAAASTASVLGESAVEGVDGDDGGPARAGASEEKAPVEPRTITALDRVRVVGMLRGAETALADNRLQSPKGNNAYEKYIAVLEIDPSNADAKRGLYVVSSRYLSLAESSIRSGKLDQARDYLTRAATVTADHSDLARVREALEGAVAGSGE
jgi:hypothetical protein